MGMPLEFLLDVLFNNMYTLKCILCEEIEANYTDAFSVNDKI
jgi:hypothetical protein